MPLLEKGVFPVIVPLAALLENHFETAKRMGVNAWKWDPTNITLDPEDGLIFVAAEQVDGRFFRWCLYLRGQGRLVRIGFDEGHLVMLAKDYRDALANMQKLIETSVPLLILSATVPPVHEKSLLDHFGLPTAYIIQEGTQRPNISLNISQYKDCSDAVKALLHHVLVLKIKLNEGDGMLICVRTKEDVNELVSLIKDAKAWYSKHPNKMENAKAWLNGEFMVLVSTSGMGTGAHHPNCRVVLHLSLAWGVYAYHQETGRCGRNGKPAVAIMFEWGTDNPPDLTEYNGWDTMLALSKSHDCIRETISRYMDGADRQVSCYAGKFIESGNCLALPNIDTTSTFKKIWNPNDIVALLPNVDKYQETKTIDTPEETHQQQVNWLEARIQAVCHAREPAVVDPVVEQDAKHATQKRNKETHLALKAAEMGEMNIALLKRVIRWMHNRCAFCLIKNFERSKGHKLENCLQEPGLDKHLDGYLLGSDKLTASCSKANNLPRDNSVCYTCHWPHISTGIHPGDSVKPCAQDNQVMQLFWLMRLDPDIWKAMSSQFILETQGETGASLIKWAWTSYKEEKWQNRKVKMLNEWRVIMCFFASEIAIALSFHWPAAISWGPLYLSDARELCACICTDTVPQARTLVLVNGSVEITSRYSPPLQARTVAHARASFSSLCLDVFRVFCRL
ncbi:ATP-dependent DNA helicase tlh2 OS=Schizosaccharomyces pombe (strain 972 / ATCC 24843) GN=tlh2 PE=2 SV=1 [Rhizoctonia solani AG-1 IB]|uniref:DNA 3'-5' helicase n=1 Tax=Thanatephorus cucumeris (strain AG1-IB / isolate 7/3/14) TaxID=1108050 RepID=A0A0B7G626_THACB|nr:ATP-dependent DNA helicase tlh2 OS=Schizosaccharomyces pombe (strain 972 / ATCC 24843) GN=tlh2 PE=2 SV=1 [Rhizoctonia solani AG-1 IB]